MALPNGNMEIVFSFDTTGSMADCLNEVRGRVSDMVQRLQADIPGIKLALFVHGDYGDIYDTKYVDLTDDITQLVDLAQNARSTHGGDTRNPDECYELVLHEVRTKLSWTAGTQRALVMIGDCKPHEPDYKTNTLNIDWRKEVDGLAEMGVRIYSVQCTSLRWEEANSDNFYETMATQTDGQHLKLDDFKNIFDFLMSVCYREKGDDLFHSYEKEVRGRCGPINKDLDQMFGNLRDNALAGAATGSGVVTTPPAPKPPTPQTAAAVKITKTPARPAKAKPTAAVKMTKTPARTTPKVKPTAAVKMTKTPTKKAVTFTNRLRQFRTSPRSVGTAKKVSLRGDKKAKSLGVDVKFVDKNLPKLRRENVPESNFNLREMDWSSWKPVISANVNNKLGITRARHGTARGFRAPSIFNGDTKVRALYEVAVQPKQRARKYVLYSKLCKRGFVSTGNWERCLFGRRDIKAQIDKVLEKKCSVFIRRLVLKGYNVRQKALFAQQRYDYAWKAIRSERASHRPVTKSNIDISEDMDLS